MLCFLTALREFEAEDLQFLQKVKLTKSIPNNVSGLSDEKRWHSKAHILSKKRKFNYIVAALTDNFNSLI